ncbi:arylamine N-acetyltransferase [Leucobacter viscericola]|uniref:Arylamine N-acetyltransferase n=1 Tax=Leucobacter viscericola TaxID=2714935 RepID=A0A6G7XCV3_9MICO|nr:arylamine N-acetyltransferase [Leucobacter viscericola]QIK62201.1 arylamine N-acetyltransferase [Leucobacter viscericola]
MDWLDEHSSPELAARFRDRIGFPIERALFGGETGSRVDRDALEALLVAVGRSIPFENLALMEGNAEKINPVTIVAKILDRWEGGLCYEINPLLALALRGEGLDARVIRATIADPDTDDGWFALSRTHVAVLLTIGGDLFLADAGFGLKQPLGLVPVGDDEGVRTPHGRYRVVAGSQGAQWMLQFDHGGGWTNGYGFSADDQIDNAETLDEIRDLIAYRSESVFNRGPLVALPTERGRLVLSVSRLTEVRDGRKSVHPLRPEEIDTVARLFFRSFATA